MSEFTIETTTLHKAPNVEFANTDIAIDYRDWYGNLVTAGDIQKKVFSVSGLLTPSEATVIENIGLTATVTLVDYPFEASSMEVRVRDVNISPTNTVCSVAEDEGLFSSFSLTLEEV